MQDMLVLPSNIFWDFPRELIKGARSTLNNFYCLFSQIWRKKFPEEMAQEEWK